MWFKKSFAVYRDNIYLLPTVQIKVNEQMYMTRNLAVEFHFIVFHARLMWLWERRNDGWQTSNDTD